MKVLLLLIILATVYCYPQNGIYVGLKHISKFNGISGGVEFEKNYYISQYLKTTALNARSACRSYSKDMDLVSFETREEFLKIRTKLSAEIGQNPVIVGGFAHKLSNNKFDYYWISSSTKIDYTYDASREEKCLALQNEGAVAYVRINCDESYLFICQDLEYQYAN